MVSRVVRVRARAVVGDTVMVDGRAAVVVDLLPREPGRARAARATHDPPCRVCERRLQYDAPHRRWRCPDCRTTYSPAALAAVCRGGRAQRPTARARHSRRCRGPAAGGGGGRCPEPWRAAGVRDWR